MRAYALAAILSCYMGLIVCAPAETSAVSDHMQHQTRLTGRSPNYNFGLGKRRYILRTTELGTKRIPHYDFGLGRKRSVAYNFGLGKRSENFDYDDDLQLAEQLLSNWETARLVDSEMPSDYDVESFRGKKNYFPRPSTVYEPKRSRPYSFGLGKRARAYDFGLGKKRSNEEFDKRLPNRYNFGLGRR
ncbi:allatostatin-A isoform X2 [Culicoides brevitarsis]|uniref:allatostatin-A isoform X2 n=1 Tax=Culicoides brevitarsis TaxID=469753 RepID=UPI00307B8596